MAHEIAVNKHARHTGADNSKHSATGILYSLSILYFLLPCLIFLLGFTRTWVIFVVGFPLVYAVYSDIHYELNSQINKIILPKNILVFLTISFIACAWTALFGAGFIGPPTGDQLKNLMIFHDLAVNSWPVIYPTMSPNFRFLSYPLGYYLAPALFIKTLGWPLGTFSIFVWTAAGVALLWSWFYVIFSRFAWFAIIIFILFSGWDIIGVLLQGQPTPPAGSHLEWWSGWTFLQYSSNATVMAWSTQHSAAQWLFPMLLLYRLVYCKNARGSALLVSLAAFWSHLTLLGIIVFLPLYFQRIRLLQALKDTALLALPFLLLVAAFYTSKAPGAIESGFIWERWPTDKSLPILLWFYLLEFGLLSLFIYANKNFTDRDESLLFRAATIALIIIPIYQIGWSNDVSMRVSAIPLFILFIYFSSVLQQAWASNRKPVIAVGSLYIFIAAFTPVNEMFRQLSFMLPQQFFIANISDENWDRGFNRRARNCFITSVPRSFSPRAGDQVEIYGNGQFEIISTQANNGFQNICLPLGAAINQRPVGPLSLTFYRNSKSLHDKFAWHFYKSPESVGSIVGVWPQQYTGAETSFFYKYLLAHTSN